MYKRLINKLILLITVVITSVFVFNYSFGTSKYSPTIRFFGDALGYYLYLPSTFIYHTLESPEKIPTDKYIQDDVLTYLDQLKANRTPKGHTLIQYTYGVAFMESPFFLIAHAYEKISGHQANGYSIAYIYMIKLSSFFYAILGLILVYNILKRYFDTTQSLLGTLLIFTGSNLFWFSLYLAGMSHVPLFFLYALLIWLTINAHEKPGWLLFISSGLVAGLITIIRPTDIVCLFIPLLYNVYDKETIRKKIAFIKDNKLNIFFFGLAFLVPIIPQLIYWKVITGNYICYSYGSQSFNWSHPKIIEGLFYGANGWLMYSPIMIFSVIGMCLYKYVKSWAWALWVIFPVYTYVIYSWYCYNYINGLGSRPMIDIYPLLAIPFTAFINIISHSKKFIKAICGVLIVFFIALNINYSIQEAKGMLSSEASNLVYNLNILFRTHLEYNDLITLDTQEVQPDTGKIKKICTLACNNYDDSVSSNYIKDAIGGSKFFYHLTNADYGPGFTVTYDKEKFKGAKWLKCSGRFMYPDYPASWKRHMLVLEIPGKLWKGCQIENKIGGWDKDHEMTIIYQKPKQWGYIYFYTKIPNNLTNGDLIKVYVWDMAKTDLYMDDICLELYKPE